MLFIYWEVKIKVWSTLLRFPNVLKLYAFSSLPKNNTVPFSCSAYSGIYIILLLGFFLSLLLTSWMLISSQKSSKSFEDRGLVISILKISSYTSPDQKFGKGNVKRTCSKCEWITTVLLLYKLILSVWELLIKADCLLSTFIHFLIQSMGRKRPWGLVLLIPSRSTFLSLCWNLLSLMHCLL